MPVYNEVNTIQEITKRVKAVDLGQGRKELIIVDDASIEGTREILDDLRKAAPHKVYFYAQNTGKGAALKTALTYAEATLSSFRMPIWNNSGCRSGILIKPILNGLATVVYGSGLSGGKVARAFNF
jgi:glycosyltransferase involved in cell wall biosynthesis